MEDSALDAELIALVEKSIAQLAPTVQQLCGKDDICMALQSLGCIRVSDLQLLLSGDLLIIQAAVGTLSRMMRYLEIWFPCDPAALICSRTDVCL